MPLRRRLEHLREKHGADAVAVSFYDYETREAFSHEGARYFHAASTIKVAVLLALYDAVEKRRFRIEDLLHVRNRFVSVAPEGGIYRVGAERDANGEVHKAIGNTMRLHALAEAMITTSSNLATNLLLDLVGVEEARAALKEWGVKGVKLVRGVEDEAAHRAGLNNEVTADGLVALFRLIEDGEAFSKEAAEDMKEILFGQQFRSGLPAGLPRDVREQARVAHKTGEISTVAHDAGLVFLPDRKPYAIAVMTEWTPEAGNGRSALVAALARAVYDTFVAEHEHAHHA
ncbi:MAG TPA: serine hydrolase [Rhodothermales bacterium]|nr:serine hydrolase [Rhodothermales bacterium]